MKNLSRVIVASAAGIVVGSALGILFAPQKGVKTRKGISKKSKRLLGKINENVGKEKLLELKKEFEEHIEKIDDRIKKFAHIN